jgi:hypothetical protein
LWEKAFYQKDHLEGETMVTFQLEQSQEKLTSHSGLALFGTTLSGSQLENKLNRIELPTAKQEPHISHNDVMVSYIGLLGLGQSAYEAIEPFRADEAGFKLHLAAVPSCATLRQRLDQLAEMPEAAQLLLTLKEESLAILKSQKVVLTPVLRDLVPLDIDVTPLDNSKSHKENVSRTYKGFDGYAPIMAYIGREGYLVDVELRPGKQHCQKETPAFLRETLTLARQLTAAPLLARLDSGNDATANLAILIEAGVDFIIKRNLRKESQEVWLKRARLFGQATETRPGKTVYRGDVSLRKSLVLNGEKTARWLRCVFDITERTITAQGQHLLIPDLEVDTYWVSLADDPVETIIEQYHDHATSEQYHAEFKGEIDLERLPSGKFKTNQLVLHCALVAYNNLRLIGQLANEGDLIPLRKPAHRRRLKTVIQNLMYLAARVVRHARRFKLSFGRHSPWFPVFRQVYLRLSD